jgi:hypothetical protein
MSDRVPDWCCEVATVEQLRQHSAPEAGRVYLVTDRGREGRFYYDAADGATPDNAGTVLVTAAGARFMRVYDGAVNVRWFGAEKMQISASQITLSGMMEKGR